MSGLFGFPVWQVNLVDFDLAREVELFFLFLKQWKLANEHGKAYFTVGMDNELKPKYRL